MGFFDRMANMVRGFLGLFIGGLESRNPAAVYEAAIQARQDQYQKLMKAVSGIVYLRNKLEKDIETKSGELKELMAQIPVAVQRGEEAIALQLIEKKNLLTEDLDRLKGELEQTARDAEKHKQDLLEFQGEIQKLKDERDRMLARNESAKARIAIQDQLSGFSVEADLKALDGVREAISRNEAQADLGTELGAESMDTKMKGIRAAAKSSAAQAELDQYKVQLGLSPAEDQEKNLGQQQSRTEKTL